MTGPIHAVIFDWGGTLTPWHTVDLAECWRACGLDEAAAGRLHLAEMEVWRRVRDRQESGTLAEVFAAAGVTMTPATLAGYFGWWEAHTYTDPDVPGLFAALRARGLKIGILSNTLWPRDEHERVFRRDGVLDLIDAAVYTSEIPWSKPHREAFRAAREALGVADPAACVFVGDRPFDDVHGAKGIGMRAVLVRNSTVPPFEAAVPDATITRLSELPACLDRW